MGVIGFGRVKCGSSAQHFFFIMAVFLPQLRKTHIHAQPYTSLGFPDLETVSIGLLYKLFVLSYTIHLAIHNLAS